MAEADSTVGRDSKRAAAVPEKSYSLYGVTARYADHTTILEQSGIAETPASFASTKAGQLHALLHMTYGEGRAVFDTMSDDLREQLMWLASDLASQIHVLTQLESGG
ncbi:UNVERIFIED_ORG: hypothetical protein J2Y81_002107 [Paraburkholderia sediminicola]|nr:hypothetical protein [Paraburkholderia sediminicola]